MRFDLRVMATIALIVTGGTCFVRSEFPVDIDFYHVAMMQLMVGLGGALFFTPVTVIQLSDLNQDGIASGSGLANFLRTLGGGFAASLTTLTWDRRAAVHLAQLAEGINAYRPIAQKGMDQLGHGNMPLMPA